MKRLLTMVTVCLLALLITAAGCVTEDDDSPGTFAGEPAIGYWTGELTETFDTTDPFEPSRAVTSFEIIIDDTGYVLVSYLKEEVGEDISRTSTADRSGSITKSDEYVYILEIDELGTYIMTVHEVSLATLTAPSGFECELTQ